MKWYGPEGREGQGDSPERRPELMQRDHINLTKLCVSALNAWCAVHAAAIILLYP